jgi:DNA-binding response OmpR family regulator
VDTPSRSLRSVATGPLQGVALALYFVLLPYVLETKWRFSYTITNGALLRDLLVGLGIFWAIFLVLLVVYVNQLRQRRTVPANGCAWLAGLIIIALPFLVTSSAGAAATQSPHAPVASVVARPALDQSSAMKIPGAWRVPSPASHRGFALFALALAAKGRRDRLTGAPRGLSDDELDELARRLHEGDAQLIAQLRDVVGSARDGEVLITDAAFEVDARLDFDPVAVSLIADRSDGLALGYAREGGALPVDMSWSDDDLATRIVALHDGTVTFAQSDNELMRALARRRDLSTLVVYLGDPAELDEEIRALCVTLRAASGTVDFRESSTREVRVELLRAYPQVQGLQEDFTPTLRRRCVEMVAYLAMHAGEPVTGDRLRSRVLVHANVDASKTTLSNTASSVRRSLGSDSRGHHLEPVSSGLYHLRAVGLDVADFHRLVARGRTALGDEAFGLYIEALRLVHGEPLASVLKGFEWFTFEAHRAQLQRDGEWVALALHDAALERGDVETAFWALRQGLLLDPDSQDLLDALERVPRLRQFRGDGAGAAQHQSVRPGRAVAMSWAFERFGR